MKKNIVERKIMWGDLDSCGIVFYPRYYEWIDASGHLFFEAIGLNLNTLLECHQVQFSLIESACSYSRPGRYHQTIRIVTQIEQLTRKIVQLNHTIFDAAENALMVSGMEKRICIDATDPKNIRAMDIPEEIYAVLKEAAETTEE